jgi:hypothetical protein
MLIGLVGRAGLVGGSVCQLGHGRGGWFGRLRTQGVGVARSGRTRACQGVVQVDPGLSP